MKAFKINLQVLAWQLKWAWLYFVTLSKMINTNSIELMNLNVAVNDVFFRKLFQSTRLYIKGILSGWPATMCLVNGGNESIG